jgi:hypothetical protein
MTATSLISKKAELIQKAFMKQTNWTINILRSALTLSFLGLLLTFLFAPPPQEARSKISFDDLSASRCPNCRAVDRVAPGRAYFANGQPSPITTSSWATLSEEALNFGYQLVGTTGTQITETLTNSWTTPVVINDLSVLGLDHDDFTLTYNFSLPIAIAPAQSVAINVTFAPSLPWRRGTRSARLVISAQNGSQRETGSDEKLKSSQEKDDETSVPLTGIGATCGGPVASCSSGCADADDDGLNDAWERGGGIDLNNDGRIDETKDLLLPGADPNRPDVYLKYDYMVATTTSPIGTPPHSHEPPEKAVQQVVEAFALHGVALHIDPQHDAIPEVLVTTLDPNPTTACAGDDFVTMRTLREQHFGDRKWAYHYAVFGHNAVLPDTGDGSNCPSDPECLGYPDPTSSGSAELPGSSFIVAFGADVDEGNNIGVETVAGTFMHELGHNLGLKHGSLAAPGPQECMTFKPNYLSVMDYLYQSSGIAVADHPGSNVPKVCSGDEDCPSGSHCTDDLGGFGAGNVCYRVDYSREKLLDLNERDLDETLGVGGRPTDTDLVNYIVDVPGLFAFLQGSSYGPIDWNGNGQATESSVQVDIDNDNGTPNNILLTADDWETVNGLFKNLNFKFQCSSAFVRDEGGASSAQLESSTSTTELGLSYAREHHIRYPLATVSLVPNPATARANLKQPGPDTTDLALLGAPNLDVSQVDLASLSADGARPFAVSVEDVNNDGIPDLVLQLRKSDIRLPWYSTRVHLTGWLKNSRSFVGETEWAVDCQR